MSEISSEDGSAPILLIKQKKKGEMKKNSSMATNNAISNGENKKTFKLRYQTILDQEIFFASTKLRIAFLIRTHSDLLATNQIQTQGFPSLS